MKLLLKKTITLWLKRLIFPRKLLRNNKRKYWELRHLSYVDKCVVGNYNTFYEYASLNNSSFGNFVYIGQRTIINNASIGSYCSIVPDVKIGLGIHPTNLISTPLSFFSTRKQCQITFVSEGDMFEELSRVIIGNDVWMERNAIITDNVTIGDEMITAAGAVVNKDIELYPIIGGMPAHLIKKRFDNKKIDILLKSQWWHRDISWIEKNYKLFGNSGEFFEFFDKE